jgi:tetratricopeptide (TPR) repeat protein
VALAELEIAAGQPDKALQYLKKGVAVCPAEPVLHNNIGMCYLAKADYQSALDSFSRAVELDALVPRYRANRAMALGLLGRYDQCLAAYSTVVTPVEAHHNLSVLCRIRGDMERAQLEQQESVYAQSHTGPPAAVSAVELGTQALSVPAGPVAAPVPNP